ncbi:MAG: peptide chain release factor N(5)-glutamine methyltransferase [Methyloversatilis sp.]|uniref:peptide chain release factor N(5)-glutamine methyltransferase n=1 Tax=Methyloversatilis sp. TaxID=2569862 RepID=UPI0027363E79|nr:peptide chain release factor N(5)-glutamine methyltransferase [Methyloversatilis sp.]MDP3872695.1 peptide chain release factor N(5)-glutamine methyltransferase [Methyloversatilis sp.]
MTLDDWLRSARTRIDSRDAQVLAAHALGCDRAGLIAGGRMVLAAASVAALDALLERRASGEPVAYLVGRREFFGLDLAVAPGVLIPRPDTELLVELALARIRDLDAPRVLDAGTGSGAIALAIKAHCPQAQVSALDRSDVALRVARGNAQRLGLEIGFFASNWLEAVNGHEFHCIVSNPPYIRVGDEHLAQGDLRFEPEAALVGGADGLDDLRRLCGSAPERIAPGGWLLCEHGYDQAPAVRALMRCAGLTDVSSWRDLAGIERVTGGVMCR